MKLPKLLAVLLLFPLPAAAMDLDAMQEMAIHNRDVVQRYQVNLERSHESLRQTRGSYFPSVDLSYTVNSLDEDSIFEAKENSVAAGQVRWNLFSGFRDRYAVQSAELVQEVEQLRLTAIQQDVQLAVALAYLRVWERRANLLVAKSEFETLEKVYRDGENRYQVGLIGKNELLKFRVDYDNADIRLKAADAGLKKSVNDLSRQVGAPVGLVDLDFEDFTTLPGAKDIKELERQMFTLRSELKVLRRLIDVAEARKEAAKSGYYPNLDAIGSYSRYDNDYLNGAGSDEEEELRGQLVLSVNLFQGFTTEAAVAGAKLDSRGATYDLEELKDSLLAELENLAIDFQVSLESVEVARRSIEQAEENLRITQLKYKEGLQQEADLLDAITNLSRAKYNEVAVLQTVFSNNFKLVRMVDGF